MEISFFGAFAAGALSFLSPCVLPLVPAYLCFLAGCSFEDLTASDRSASDNRRVASSAAAFVVGFSAVFLAMGATASSLNRLLLDNMQWLSVAAGIVIVIFGLHYMGALRIAFLNFEKRVHVASKPTGLAGATLLGMAFAFGWTPCVGPILATILMVAASGDSIGYGVSLLGTYAAGLGLPFLLAALAVGPFMKAFARLKRHMRKVELTIGGLLVTTGALILTGSLSEVGNALLDAFPSLGRIG